MQFCFQSWSHRIRFFRVCIICLFQWIKVKPRSSHLRWQLSFPAAARSVSYVCMHARVGIDLDAPRKGRRSIWYLGRYPVWNCKKAGHELWDQTGQDPVQELSFFVTYLASISASVRWGSQNHFLRSGRLILIVLAVLCEYAACACVRVCACVCVVGVMGCRADVNSTGKNSTAWPLCLLQWICVLVSRPPFLPGSGVSCLLCCTPAHRLPTTKGVALEDFGDAYLLF